MAAFYPGAGTDFTPTVFFPDITFWYYLDSQPQSEHGSLIEKGLDRPSFVFSLCRIAKQYDFHITKEVRNCITFENNRGQTVEYHINSVFPKDMDPTLLSMCSTFVMIGYDPNGWPIDFLELWPHVITSNKSIVETDEMDRMRNASIDQLTYHNQSWQYWLDKENTLIHAKKNIIITRLQNQGPFRRTPE